MRVSIEEALSRGWISASELATPTRASIALCAPSSASPRTIPAKKTSAAHALTEAGKVSNGRAAVRDAEGQEQAQLISAFRARHPDIGDLLIHIPNGGSRKNAFEGWRFKQQGVRAGVSDLLLPLARGGYFGLWIEFKATPPMDAAVSAAQQDWIAAMLKHGYYARVCLGLAPALRLLQWYTDLAPTVVAPVAEAAPGPAL